jgi:hypothetical protein
MLGGRRRRGRYRLDRFEAALAWIAGLALALPGAAAFAAGPQSLLGFHASAVQTGQDLPDLNAKAATMTVDVDILAISKKAITIRYKNVLTRANGVTARRVVSDVTIPLSRVTLSSDGGLQFACSNGSRCIGWTHKEFFDDTGHVFPPRGQSETFGFAMSDEDTSTVMRALCPVTKCT